MSVSGITQVLTCMSVYEKFIFTRNLTIYVNLRNIYANMRIISVNCNYATNYFISHVDINQTRQDVNIVISYVDMLTYISAKPCQRCSYDVRYQHNLLTCLLSQDFLKRLIGNLHVNIIILHVEIIMSDINRIRNCIFAC